LTADVGAPERAKNVRRDLGAKRIAREPQAEIGLRDRIALVDEALVFLERLLDRVGQR
jgi:hypothetical protein